MFRGDNQSDKAASIKEPGSHERDLEEKEEVEIEHSSNMVQIEK